MLDLTVCGIYINLFYSFRSLEKINQTKEEIEKQRKLLQRRKPPSEGKHGKNIADLFSLVYERIWLLDFETYDI